MYLQMVTCIQGGKVVLDVLITRWIDISSKLLEVGGLLMLLGIEVPSAWWVTVTRLCTLQVGERSIVLSFAGAHIFFFQDVSRRRHTTEEMCSLQDDFIHLINHLSPRPISEPMTFL